LREEEKEEEEEEAASERGSNFFGLYLCSFSLFLSLSLFPSLYISLTLSRFPFLTREIDEAKASDTWKRDKTARIAGTTFGCGSDFA
jgi:hypothetical protein